MSILNNIYHSTSGTSFLPMVGTILQSSAKKAVESVRDYAADSFTAVSDNVFRAIDNYNASQEKQAKAYTDAFKNVPQQISNTAASAAQHVSNAATNVVTSIKTEQQNKAYSASQRKKEEDADLPHAIEQFLDQGVQSFQESTKARSTLEKSFGTLLPQILHRLGHISAEEIEKKNASVLNKLALACAKDLPADQKKAIKKGISMDPFWVKSTILLTLMSAAAAAPLRDVQNPQQDVQNPQQEQQDPKTICKVPDNKDVQSDPEALIQDAYGIHIDGNPNAMVIQEKDGSTYGVTMTPMPESGDQCTNPMDSQNPKWDMEFVSDGNLLPEKKGALVMTNRSGSSSNVPSSLTLNCKKAGPVEVSNFREINGVPISANIQGASTCEENTTTLVPSTKKSTTKEPVQTTKTETQTPPAKTTEKSSAKTQKQTTAKGQETTARSSAKTQKQTTAKEEETTYASTKFYPTTSFYVPPSTTFGISSTTSGEAKGGLAVGWIIGMGVASGLLFLVCCAGGVYVCLKSKKTSKNPINGTYYGNDRNTDTNRIELDSIRTISVSTQESEGGSEGRRNETLV